MLDFLWKFEFDGRKIFEDVAASLIAFCCSNFVDASSFWCAVINVYGRPHNLQVAFSGVDLESPIYDSCCDPELTYIIRRMVSIDVCFGLLLIVLVEADNFGPPLWFPFEQPSVIN